MKLSKSDFFIYIQNNFESYVIDIVDSYGKTICYNSDFKRMYSLKDYLDVLCGFRCLIEFEDDGKSNIVAKCNDATIIVMGKRR